MKEWRDMPFVEHPVMLLVSLGHSKISRREFMKLNNPRDLVEDLKPEPEEVIRWIQMYIQTKLCYNILC